MRSQTTPITVRATEDAYEIVKANAEGGSISNHMLTVYAAFLSLVPEGKTPAEYAKELAANGDFPRQRKHGQRF